MYLEVKDISVWFDTAQVLDKVNLNVAENELVSVVGPNGAGKSTLLRTIAGLVHWERDAYKGTKAGRIRIEGNVFFAGEDISNLTAYERARRRLAICPERGRPFRELSIAENLMAASYSVKSKKEIEQNLDRVFHLFPVLKERKKQSAGTLSGGERTMLAIARSLMSEGKLLLIDEPSVGLSPLLKETLFERIKEIHSMGLTMLLVEQDVGYAFDVAQRNYVISKGHVVAEGVKDQLLADEFLRKVYLGL